LPNMLSHTMVTFIFHLQCHFGSLGSSMPRGIGPV
jgi:hypothetical protein